MRCTPMKCTPMRCTPMRCTPMRCSPMRCSPMRCSPMRCSPMRCISTYEMHTYKMHTHDTSNLEAGRPNDKGLKDNVRLWRPRYWGDGHLKSFPEHALPPQLINHPGESGLFSLGSPPSVLFLVLI